MKDSSPCSLVSICCINRVLIKIQIQAVYHYAAISNNCILPVCRSLFEFSTRLYMRQVRISEPRPA